MSIGIISILCPYRLFAAWFTGILSIIYALCFLYGFWFVGSDTINSGSVFLGIILTGASFELCIVLVKAVLISSLTIDELKNS